MRSTIILICLLIVGQKIFSQSNEQKEFFQRLNLKQFVERDQSVHYDLNEIITIVEKSIEDTKTVVIPDGVTEFERLLFTARRIQHNDSQLIAIKLFEFMLEFELYRTKGEELYLKLLMSTSLEYIGSRVLAKNYLEDIFPEFLDYLNYPKHKWFFLNHYAGILMRNKDYDEANKAYGVLLGLSVELKDSIALFNTRNNYGHTFHLLGELDSAALYFKENQKEKYRHLSPIIYAFSFGNYAGVLLDKNELDSVIFYSQREVSILRSIPTTVGLDNTYKLIGECYERLGEADSAHFYFTKALEGYKLNKNIEGAIEAIKKVIHIKSISRMDEEVKELLIDYQNLNDSLIASLSNKTYEGDINVFNYLKILDETHLSKKQFDILETRNRELNYLVLGLAVLLISLLVIIINRRAHRIRLKKANNDLLSKNKALKQSYDTISETNAKNEILLKELHHRVKNNLQMIISLFNLQNNSQQKNIRASEMFQVAKDRVFSIALVHKKLYQSGQFANLNFREYLEAFIQEIIENNDQRVNINLQIEDLYLSIDSAVPLGLIVNELFTNSLKHAKPDKELLINIKQNKIDMQSELIYTDNGLGIDLKKDTEENGNTIGITLIKLLSEQLGADTKFKEPKKGEYGFWFSIKGNFK